VVVVVVVLLVLASVVQSDAHFWGRHKHRTLGIGIEISSVLCSAAAFACLLLFSLNGLPAAKWDLLLFLYFEYCFHSEGDRWLQFRFAFFISFSRFPGQRSV